MEQPKSACLPLTKLLESANGSDGSSGSDELFPSWFGPPEG